MKRFTPYELGIFIYDDTKYPDMPLPQKYGISYRLIEEYEQKIEEIDNRHPSWYDSSGDIAKATFALLFVIALCFIFSGNGHDASYLLFPAILIPLACALNWYLKKRNRQKRNKELKMVRSEIIEKYLRDWYDWYNKTYDYKLKYYDII